MGGRDRAAAIALLALLLCQPNRQAHRDWIMEQFWPESSQRVAVHRLENIFSCLRKLLRPPTGEESLLRSITGKKSSGTSYGLEAYPKLWVDLDALTGNIEQAARMERFGEDALPFWQRAFDFFKRGPFLVDDPYDSYATWVKEQREHLDGYSRQCVHALARLYLANHTEAGKAEAQLVLRTYWQRHKTDEDALRPLLELLGEQERYQEAKQYYQQLLLALSELEPDEEGQPRAPDARTYDIREYLRTKQIQRKQPQSQSISQERAPAYLNSSILPVTSATPSFNQQDATHAFSSPLLRGFPQNFAPVSKQNRENDEVVGRRGVAEYLGIAGAVLLQHSENLFYLESHERLRRALRKPATIDNTTIKHLESMTDDCWRMIPAVAGVVSHYSRGYVLEQLDSVTRLLEGSQPLMIHQHLCSIAGELSLITANISSNMRDYYTAKIYYELSIEAAQEAKNIPLQAVGLVRLSFNSTRNDRPDVALPLVQEAMYLMAQSDKQATMTTSAWIIAALAEVYANLKNAKDCFEALEQAELHIDSTIREDDPYHTTFSSSSLAGYKGVCYTLLHLPEDAEKVLHEALTHISASSIYQKGYILSDLASSCIQQGKIHEMYTHASGALAVAVQTKAPEIFQRVRKLRTDIDAWSSPSSVKNLDTQIRDLEHIFP